MKNSDSPKKKKVFLVIPWAPSHQGGVTRVVQQIVAFWPDDGAQARPVLVVDDWNHPVENRAGDALYFRFRAWVVNGFLPTLVSFARLPAALYRIHKLLRADDVAAVNFHYTDYSPLGVALLKRLKFYRGRLVISFHGTDVCRVPNRLERWARLFCLRSADALVACSNSLADRAAETYGLDRGRFDVVLNGVDVATFRPGAPETEFFRQGGGQRLPAEFIVNIGSFIPRKAHAALIDAFALVAPRFASLHLVIAGPTGPLLEELRLKIEAMGLAPRVHLLVGISAPDVAHLLAKARLCVQPALAESMPLSVLEAGACGVPVAASDIPGHDELVFEGRTGRLFRVADPRDCARVVSEMLQDPLLSQACADRFKQVINDELTWSNCVARYRRLYGV